MRESTTDAVVVGCDPNGDPAEYTGSATTVGVATQACTRDAVLGSLQSWYPEGEYPTTVEDAEHGVRTTASSEVFRL
ncbi:adenosylcobinamide amidohydrolase [Halobacteriaceae archaeon SHR40]|uniref:adenosylcobinamide amidohydrolase n=1 Tax=Halovenus amylolytica TaxID=2500550 RepID=UPI000FE3112E